MSNATPLGAVVLFDDFLGDLSNISCYKLLIVIVVMFRKIVEEGCQKFKRNWISNAPLNLDPEPKDIALKAGNSLPADFASTTNLACIGRH